MVTHFDVVIVGASIAGSTAAILLGRAGLRVALVERHGRLDAFKALCTHHVMACATPTIHRLGLDTTIEAAGGVRNGLNLYTPWGWVVTPPDTLHGYSIRREILDPMLRRTAAETCGVDLRLGQKVVALLSEQAGVRVRDAHGAEHDILAPLVVGADGVHSSVAALAGGTTRVVPNNRFMYFAEFTGVRLHSTGRTELWMHEPAISYAMPNDGGVTVLATMPTKAELPSFRSNPEAALLAALRKLPDAPRFDPGGRVSKIIGAPDCPLITRTAVPASTVALIGDAALTSDPSQGVGCGWAFQSAEWLADEVAPALLDGRPVGSGAPQIPAPTNGSARTPDDHRAGGESRTAHRHRPSDRAGGGPRHQDSGTPLLLRQPPNHTDPLPHLPSPGPRRLGQRPKPHLKPLVGRPAARSGQVGRRG